MRFLPHISISKTIGVLRKIHWSTPLKYFIKSTYYRLIQRERSNGALPLNKGNVTNENLSIYLSIKEDFSIIT